MLLEKTKKDGSDPFLGLLNLRNTPRDTVLGSPAQRLMSRRLRMPIPTAKSLLTPKVKPTSQIQNQLSKKRNQQKIYHDKHAKPLQPLHLGQTVRLQTKKGFNKLGCVQEPSLHPRSYHVKVNGKTLRRNRRHLMPVAENPGDCDEPEHSDYSQAPPTQEPAQVPLEDDHGLENASEQVSQPVVQPTAVTRSGRISKPDPKYTDFVK